MLPLTVHTYGYTVQSASYEIRSLDTERKIAETQIDNFTRDGDDLRADVQIENLVEEGEEYLFILTLEGEQDQQVRYYTRIMLPDDCHEKECLDFAAYFHETALSGNYSELNTYLETDTNTDMDTLSQVTIHSSIQQVGMEGLCRDRCGRACGRDEGDQQQLCGAGILLSDSAAGRCGENPHLPGGGIL